MTEYNDFNTDELFSTEHVVTIQNKLHDKEFEVHIVRTMQSQQLIELVSMTSFAESFDINFEYLLCHLQCCDKPLIESVKDGSFYMDKNHFNDIKYLILYDAMTRAVSVTYEIAISCIPKSKLGRFEEVFRRDVGC